MRRNNVESMSRDAGCARGCVVWRDLIHPESTRWTIKREPVLNSSQLAQMSIMCWSSYSISICRNSSTFRFSGCKPAAEERPISCNRLGWGLDYLEATAMPTLRQIGLRLRANKEWLGAMSFTDWCHYLQKNI